MLQRKPFGIREGLANLLVCLALLSNEKSIAIYNNGTYVRGWSSELYDVIIRHPKDFTIRWVVMGGSLKGFVQKLNKSIPGAPSIANNEDGVPLNGFLHNLYVWFRLLPDYSKRTLRLSKETQGLRTAIIDAIDPIGLIGEDIPKVFGVKNPFQEESVPATDYEEMFTFAIQELQKSYQELLRSIRSETAKAIRTPDEVPSIRKWFRDLDVQVVGGVRDREAKAFLQNRAIDETLESQQWIESIGTALIGQQPRFWMDHHLDEFSERLAVIGISLEDSKRRAYATARSSRSKGSTLRRLILERPDGEKELIYEPGESGGIIHHSAVEVVRGLKERYPDLTQAQLQSISAEILELLIDSEEEEHD